MDRQLLYDECMADFRARQKTREANIAATRADADAVWELVRLIISLTLPKATRKAPVKRKHVVNEQELIAVKPSSKLGEGEHAGSTHHIT